MAPFAASAQGTASAGPARPRAAQAAAGGATAGALTGVVDGFDGTPLAGVCVIAAGATGSGTALTDATGRYLVSGLRVGSYLVHYQDCRTGGQYLPAVYLPAVYGARGHARSVLIAGGFPVPLRTVTLQPTGPSSRSGATSVSVATGAVNTGINAS